MPGPVGEIGLDTDVSNQGKGVILFASRARRLALAVLAGVFLGLAGAAVASAETAAAPTPTSVQLAPQAGSGVQPLTDWWG